MKKWTLIPLFLSAVTLTSCCTYRMRTAQDVTPGNNFCERLDWRYGAGDIQIQTTKITSSLMDRWFVRTNWDCRNGLPRIVITEIDNRTDCYISTDMIRDIFEGVAINDGRFTITVGDAWDEQELDQRMLKNSYDPKYNNPTRLASGKATAPHFLAKVRITKAVSASKRFDYEDYRMTVTLYDIETQEAIDSAWDVLRKRVQR